MDNILPELAGIIEQGQAFVLCIVTDTKGSTPRKAGAKMLVFADGRTMGTVGGGAIEKQAIEDALEVIKRGQEAQIVYELKEDLAMHCGGKMTIYFEPVGMDLNLYIFGAGHVGREVGGYARELGFKVHFVDNRPEIFQQFSSDYAQQHAGDYLELASKIKFSQKDFVVITTQGHAFDEALLEVLAPENLMYLGMIGSRRKVAEARRRILEQQILTPEQLDRVDMPIGVPFHVQAPKEIALSIVARLIDVKNKNNL